MFSNCCRSKSFFLLSPLFIALTACGGGGGGSSTTITPNDQEAPSVTGVTPADTSTDVPTDQVVTATFSEDMFLESLRDGSAYTLQGVESGNNLGGEIDESDTATYTFTPFQPLPPLSKIRAKVTRDATDLSGNALDEEETWEFTTEDGAWSDATDRIERSIEDLQAASDALGNATVIWAETNNTGPRIETIRFTPETDWFTSDDVEQQQILRVAVAQYDEDEGVTAVTDPKIAFNSTGAALAVWDVENQFDEIGANNYVNGTWVNDPAPAISVQSSAGVATPDVAIEENGNGLAVWAEEEVAGSGPFKIVANRFVAGADNGWGTPQFVDTDAALPGDAADPKVAIRPNGNALVVWSLGDRIRAAEFGVDSDFTAADSVFINDDSGGSVSAPRIVIDADGNGAAIWTQNNVVVTNRYDGGWQGPKPIRAAVPGAAFEPSIATNADGNLFAVWQVGADSDVERAIVASEYTDDAWDEAERISSDSAITVGEAQVAVDADGNALAVWRQTDVQNGPEKVIANRFVTLDDSGWGDAVSIESADGTARAPKITIDGNGNGISAWIQTSPTGEVRLRTNRFE